LAPYFRRVGNNYIRFPTRNHSRSSRIWTNMICQPAYISKYIYDIIVIEIIYFTITPTSYTYLKRHYFSKLRRCLLIRRPISMCSLPMQKLLVCFVPNTNQLRGNETHPVFRSTLFVTPAGFKNQLIIIQIKSVKNNNRKLFTKMIRSITKHTGSSDWGEKVGFLAQSAIYNIMIVIRCVL